MLYAQNDSINCSKVYKPDGWLLYLTFNAFIQLIARNTGN